MMDVDAAGGHGDRPNSFFQQPNPFFSSCSRRRICVMDDAAGHGETNTILSSSNQTHSSRSRGKSFLLLLLVDYEKCKESEQSSNGELDGVSE